MLFVNDIFAAPTLLDNLITSSKDKSPRQMGAYLKNKYKQEIRDKNEERISGTSGMAISVLQDLLLNSEQAFTWHRYSWFRII